MSNLIIHPHKGFLNTKFTIHTNGYKGKRFVVKPIELFNENSSVMSKLPIYWEITKDEQHWEHTAQCAGRYSISIEDKTETEREFEVTDAIKLGGSKFKSSYIFDETPWCFVVMKDRTYFYNRNTKEQYVESISPSNISCLNESIVYFGDLSSEIIIYSLINQQPIIKLDDVVKLTNDTAIVEEDIDDKIQLTLYRFDDTLLKQASFSCDDYSVCDESESIYIANKGIVEEISIPSLKKKELDLDNKNEFIGFTNGHYVISRRIISSGTSIYIYDLFTLRAIGYIHLEIPVSAIENYNLIDISNEKSKVDQVFDLTKELRLLESTKVEYKTQEIIKILIVSDNIYFVVKENSYSINRYGSRKNSSVTYIKTLDSEFNITIEGYEYSIEQKGDEVHLKDRDYYYIIKNEKIVFKTADKVYKSSNGILFANKEDNNKEIVHYLANYKPVELCTGKFEWELFEKYGVLHETERHLFFYRKNNRWLRNALIELNYPHVIWEHCGVELWGNFQILPESEKYIVAISPNKEYYISKKGVQFYLYKKTHNDACKCLYEREEILTSIFDFTSYGKVFLSDDGEHIIYKNDEEMVLMNTTTQETESFPNLHFVSHKNGYRPLFSIDRYRRPRMIDPATLNYIDESFLNNYEFVSPDGKLYADSALNEYIKYFNKIEGKYISSDEVITLKRKYNFAWSTTADEKRSITKERNNFIYRYPYYFKSDNNDAKKELLETDDFTDKFIENRGFAIIRSVYTNEIIAEIPLGPALWFINYVAFSFDSRYIAIGGRYPNRTEYKGSLVGGLLLLYDLKEQKVITQENNSWAVWYVSFSKKNQFGAYSSEPVTYLGKIGEKNFSKIYNRNFLTFSPDGKYMAMSDQGYTPFNVGKNINWGHRPSTNVFIHSVDNPEKQVIPTIADLADGGIDSILKGKDVASCSFSKDNKKIMMVGNDGTVVIRNLYLE